MHNKVNSGGTSENAVSDADPISPIMSPQLTIKEEDSDQSGVGTKLFS